MNTAENNSELGRLKHQLDKHKNTYNLIYNIGLLGPGLIVLTICSVYFDAPETLVKMNFIWTPAYFIIAFLMYRREYPITIYEKGIKFPFYWKLRCGTQFLQFKEIEKIEERHTTKKSRFSGTKLITKDGRKYFVLQYYENEVLPHIPDEIFKRAKER